MGFGRTVVAKKRWVFLLNSAIWQWKQVTICIDYGKKA